MIEIEITSEKDSNGSLTKIEGKITFKDNIKPSLLFEIIALGPYFSLRVGKRRRKFFVFEFQRENFTEKHYKNRTMIQWIYDNIDSIEGQYR